jgi:hypothetical protein
VAVRGVPLPAGLTLTPLTNGAGPPPERATTMSSASIVPTLIPSSSV